MTLKVTDKQYGFVVQISVFVMDLLCDKMPNLLYDLACSRAVDLSCSATNLQ